MSRINRYSSSPSRLPIVVIGEWLLVLPAAVLLTAAMLRMVGGRGPLALTSGLISEWAITHVSHFGAAMLFIGMPSIVVIMGCMTLLRVWHDERAVRQDAIAVLAIFRRHLVPALLATATLLAGAILTIAVAHVITD